VPRELLIAVVVSGAIAAVVWLAMRALDPSGRVATVGSLALVGGVATGVYALVVRRWWRSPGFVTSEV